jgi:hypothetical protein
VADRALPNLRSRDLDATVAFSSAPGFEAAFRDEGSFTRTVRVADVEAQDRGFRCGALIDLDGTQLTLIEDANG